VGAEAPCAAEQRSISLPRPTRSHAHRCSCLTRQQAVSKAAWWSWKWYQSVTWATSVPILVFLGLSVLNIGTMYATDRDRRQTTSSLY